MDAADLWDLAMAGLELEDYERCVIEAPDDTDDGEGVRTHMGTLLDSLGGKKTAKRKKARKAKRKSK